MNEFLKNLYKHDTCTENGAVAHSTTGSILADQFGKSGSHRGRDISLVFSEQSELWNENPLMALRFPFYLRLVTRKCKLYDSIETEKVQKGQGNRDEAFKRLLWIAKYHPESFYKNLWLLPIVGSWKDLWTLLSMDTQGILDKEKFFETIKAGIEDDYQIDLIKKFLPRIRSVKKANTDWAHKTNTLAKEFCQYMKWSVKQYRLFKSSGLAHIFQKDICSKRYINLDFNKIPGKALFLMNKTSKGKDSFIKRHGLEKKYMAWLEKQPVAKFTGYVYELGKEVCNGGYSYGMPAYQKMTIDKQFDGLIELAKKDQGGINGNVWCALDTSGSMGSKVNGRKDLSAFDVCVSLGVYFATLNEGAFKDHVIMFDNHSKVKKISGTFTDKINQIMRSATAWGSTNFLSVIDEITRIRRTNRNIPISDYPETLLVVSDMQFNPSGSKKTNFEEAKRRLRTVFPDEFVNNFKVIWWDCIGRVTTNQPSTIDDPGTYVFSGFDGSIITLLLGGENTKIDENGKVVKLSMLESIIQSLSQEVLEQVNL